MTWWRGSYQLLITFHPALLHCDIPAPQFGSDQYKCSWDYALGGISEMSKNSRINETWDCRNIKMGSKVNTGAIRIHYSLQLSTGSASLAVAPQERSHSLIASTLRYNGNCTSLFQLHTGYSFQTCCSKTPSSAEASWCYCNSAN